MSRRSDRDEAYVEIVEDIREVMQDLQACITSEGKVAEEAPDGQSDFNDPALHKANGDMFFQFQQYDKAIAAYDKAILLDQNFADAYRARAKVYHMLASLNYEKLKQLSEQLLKQMGSLDDTQEGLER